MNGAVHHDAPRTQTMSTQGAINMVTLLTLVILAACIAHSLVSLQFVTAAKIYGGMVITEIAWMTVSLMLDDGDPAP